jgi:Tfp pilus assembly protein PilF
VAELEYAYAIYDFEIRGTLPDTLDYVSRNPPDGFRVAHPNPKGKTQGEIWRDIVMPELVAATRLIAYVDLPNANVAYEIGYGLGSSPNRKVALASHRREIPAWLGKPPFKGFSCAALPKPSDLTNQIQSENWFRTGSAPRRGREILLLCPSEGEAYVKTVRQQYPKWHQLPTDGWSFKDLPDLLKDVGAIVWIVLPHTEGEAARDGTENTALAVIAGYAEGLGVPVRTLTHRESRRVVDIAANAVEFSGLGELAAKLTNAATSLDEILAAAEQSPVALPEMPTFERPSLATLPSSDFTFTIEPRFVGRERLLGDLDDAVAGLVSRWRGTTLTGSGGVQLAWCHGFGGMGKSWFVRRAIINARTRSDVQVALVDWDNAVWRAPLAQPPETATDLCTPLAHRLGQLYSAEDLDPYWEAESRIEKSTKERTALRQKFSEERGALRRGERVPDGFRAALLAKELWSDNSAQLDRVLTQLSIDHDLEDSLFRAWAQASGSTTTDHEAVLRPDDLRVTALTRCIRNLATQRPLFVVLDTCEMLSTQLDRWLRRLLAPLCDGRTPALILIASRLAPDIGEAPGSRQGWRAEIDNVRWRTIQFDEGVRFTVDEIEQSLKAMGRPVAAVDSVAEQLHRVTLGVPLAVRALIDLHENEGDPVLSKLASVETDTDNSPYERHTEDVEHKVVELVADRLLYHLSHRQDRVSDYEDIILLSLLNEADREVLQRVWETSNVRGRITKLAQRYSLVAVGDLHETVRRFLRRRWRMEDRPAIVDEVARRLNAVVAGITLPGQPGDADYMRGLLLRLTAQSWADVAAAFKLLPPALALAICFEEQTDTLLDLAAQLAAVLPDRAIARRLRDVADNVWGDVGHDDALVAWLQGQHDRSQWSAAETQALNIVMALRDSRRGKHQDAFLKLAEALAFFRGERLPRKNEVGSALFDAGYELATSPRTQAAAADAYRAAIDLGYAIPKALNNLALLYPNERRDEAKRMFRQALELDPKEPLYVRNLGDVFKEERNFEQAEHFYRKALEIDPISAPALNRLAALFEEQKRFAEAEGVYQRAVELDPKELSYLRNLGDLYQNQDRFEEAEHWYRKALDVDPTYAAAHNGLGSLFEEQNRLPEAEAAYRRASDLNPKEPLYPRNLGNLYQKQRRYEEAEQWYRRALDVDPTYAAAHNGLGSLFEEQDRLPEAEAAYRRASDRDPKDPLYRRDLGSLYQKQRRYEEAERWFRNALDVNPTYATPHNDLGSLFEEQDRLPEAEAAYRRASDRDPKDPLYPRNLGHLCQKQRRYEEAEQWYRKALDVAPTYATAHNDLGTLFEEQDRLPEAEAAYRRAGDLRPTQPIFLRNLGNLHIKQRRYEDAERWLRKALAVDPNYATAHNDLGVLFEEQDRLPEAEAAYRRAVDLDPKDPLYPLDLGNLHTKQRRYEDAERWLRKALDVDPTYAKAHNDLGTLFEARDRLPDAEAEYRRALDLDPRQSLHWTNLGHLLEAQGRMDEAEGLYRQAVAALPTDPTAQNSLAWFLYSQKRNLEEAEGITLEAVAGRPLDANILHTLASIQLTLRGWRPAAPAVLKWAEASDAAFLMESRHTVLNLIREIVRLEHGAELCTFLELAPNAPIWRPFVSALAALSGDTSTGMDEESAAIYNELLPARK